MSKTAQLKMWLIKCALDVQKMSRSCDSRLSHITSSNFPRQPTCKLHNKRSPWFNDVKLLNKEMLGSTKLMETCVKILLKGSPVPIHRWLSVSRVADCGCSLVAIGYVSSASSWQPPVVESESTRRLHGHVDGGWSLYWPFNTNTRCQIDQHN